MKRAFPQKQLRGRFLTEMVVGTILVLYLGMENKYILVPPRK